MRAVLLLIVLALAGCTQTPVGSTEHSSSPPTPIAGDGSVVAFSASGAAGTGFLIVSPLNGTEGPFAWNALKALESTSPPGEPLHIYEWGPEIVPLHTDPPGLIPFTGFFDAGDILLNSPDGMHWGDANMTGRITVSGNDGLALVWAFASSAPWSASLDFHWQNSTATPSPPAVEATIAHAQFFGPGTPGAASVGTWTLSGDGMGNGWTLIQFDEQLPAGGSSGTETLELQYANGYSCQSAGRIVETASGTNFRQRFGHLDDTEGPFSIRYVHADAAIVEAGAAVHLAFEGATPSVEGFPRHFEDGIPIWSRLSTCPV